MTVFTPLLYLATSIAGLVLASLWVRPISRWAALVIVLLPLCLTGNALIRGEVLAPIDLAYSVEPLAAQRSALGLEGVSHGMWSDLPFQIVPWREAVRYAYAHGEWPLWNPFQHAGDPLLGSAQPAPFSPPMLLSLLPPPAEGPGLLASLGFFLAALGAFLLARELGCRELAALVAAAGWALSTALTFWIGWPLGFSQVYLPLVLLGASRTVARPGWRSASLLTMALWLEVQAGHPETTLHVVSLGVLWAVFEAWRAPRKRLGRALLTGLGAGVVALALSAPFVLSFADTLLQSAELAHRQADFVPADRSATLTGAWARVVPNFLPQGLAAEREVTSRVPFPHFLPGPGGAGSVVLMLALHGLVAHRDRRRWALLALVLAGLGIGCSFPGISDLIARLPLFDVTLNDRLIFAAAFALAMLAGLGAEAWSAGSTRRGPIACAVLVLLALGAGSLRYGPFLVRHGMPEDLVTERTLWLLAPVAVGLCAFAFPRARARALAFVLLLVVAQRTAETRPFFRTVPERAFYPPVAPLDALTASAAPYRVVGLGHTLVPNIATHYHLEDPRANQALRLHRFEQVQPLWDAGWDGIETRVADLTRPFLSFLNVRYAVTTRDVPTPPGWRRVASGERSFLLENTAALERAFVPSRVRVGGSPQRVLEEMAEKGGFGERAWIELPEARSGSPRGMPNGPGTVTTKRRGLGYVLEADMENEGWIVVSVTHWRGWRATANGAELPVTFANHAFLGLHAPRGKSMIDLHFRPKSFEIGLALSAATALGLAVLAITAGTGVDGRHGGRPLQKSAWGQVRPG